MIYLTKTQSKVYECFLSFHDQIKCSVKWCDMIKYHKNHKLNRHSMEMLTSHGLIKRDKENKGAYHVIKKNYLLKDSCKNLSTFGGERKKIKINFGSKLEGKIKMGWPFVKMAEK